MTIKGIHIETLDDAIRLSERMAKSGMCFDSVKGQDGRYRNVAWSADKVLFVIMAGFELGMQPMESIRGLTVQFDRVSMSASTIRARLRSSERYDYRITEQSHTACTMEFIDIERGEVLGEARYTIEEAKASKVTDKNALWYSDPAMMLLAAATRRGARAFTPDILGPEAGEAETGIEVGPNVQEPVVEPTAKPDTSYTRLIALWEQFEVDKDRKSELLRDYAAQFSLPIGKGSLATWTEKQWQQVLEAELLRLIPADQPAAEAEEYEPGAEEPPASMEDVLGGAG